MKYFPAYIIYKQRGRGNPWAWSVCSYLNRAKELVKDFEEDDKRHYDNEEVRYIIVKYSHEKGVSEK